MQRRFRLQRRGDFQRLRALGTRYQGEYLSLSVAPNGLVSSRFGFVIGRRVGKAVVRNKLRRRLRASLASMSKSLALGFDVVIIVRPGSVKLTYWDVCDHLSRLLRRADLIRERDGKQ